MHYFENNYGKFYCIEKDVNDMVKRFCDISEDIKNKNTFDLLG